MPAAQFLLASIFDNFSVLCTGGFAELSWKSDFTIHIFCFFEYNLVLKPKKTRATVIFLCLIWDYIYDAFPTFVVFAFGSGDFNGAVNRMKLTVL